MNNNIFYDRYSPFYAINGVAVVLLLLIPLV